MPRPRGHLLSRPTPAQWDVVDVLATRWEHRDSGRPYRWTEPRIQAELVQRGSGVRRADRVLEHMQRSGLAYPQVLHDGTVEWALTFYGEECLRGA